MHKKVKGFLVQATTKNRIVDPQQPGMIMQSEAVLVEESLPKALEEAVGQCPSNREIIRLSVAEVSVFVPVTPWNTEEAGNA